MQNLHKNLPKRFFDIFLSALALVFFSPLMIFIALLIKLTSNGPVLYWSERVGVDNSNFRMPKFRTMHIGTPVLATHLLKKPRDYLTPVGSFLRKSSLDELPQLLSILAGNMSFVGPRPALFNQDDLVKLRTHYGVHVLVPGITGWAQINGRDELSIYVKVQYDLEYLNNKSFWFDIKIIGLTFLKVLNQAGVAH